ncbi:MAG: helix-turn-helix domain-containing protein [Planctomycetota bacterium]
MQACWHPASQQLEHVLKGIWTIESNDKSVQAKVLPDATPYLVFQRDGSRLISSDNDGDTWSQASLSGPRTKAFEIQLAPSSQIFIVQLNCTGGLPVLGLPMDHVTDRCEDLTRVVDRSFQIEELSDRFLNSPCNVSCIRLFESWLNKRASEAINPQVQDAVTEMKECGGLRGVSTLATHVGVSRRHLGRLVRENIGLAPKLLEKIIRFDRAVQLTRIRPILALPQIAISAGYADQSHMNRDFMQLAGITPREVQKDAGHLVW